MLDIFGLFDDLKEQLDAQKTKNEALKEQIEALKAIGGPLKEKIGALEAKDESFSAQLHDLLDQVNNLTEKTRLSMIINKYYCIVPD